MVDFIPDSPKVQEPPVPYFEDSSKYGIAGHSTSKSIERLQDEIKQSLVQLDAGYVRFVSGLYGDKPKRYGFQVHFNLAGVPGRIDCAALPIRQETPAKKQQALCQALYFVRDWLDVESRTAVFRPGNIALIPYLIGQNGKTVAEALKESKQLPMLMPEN
jgi:hypothetical protein